jgi:glycosyltransferase involved in cell wall biosynthesis
MRLAYMAEKVFGKKLPPTKSKVAILAFVKDKEQAERIIRCFESQTYDEKTLFLITRNDLGMDLDGKIKQIIGDFASEAYIEEIRNYDLVGSFIIEDGYGPNYLTDLVLAGKFSRTEGYSKTIRGSATDSPNAPYTISDACRLNCGLVRPHLLQKEDLGRLARGDRVDVMCRTTLIDAFNYGPDGEPLTEGVFDSSVPLEAMLRASEKISPGSSVIIPRSKVLVVTPQYPSYDNVYRYVFVHRRLKAYASQGLKVDVFRIGDYHKKGFSEFDGIDIQSGDRGDLDKVLRDGQYSTVLVHFLNEDIWNALRDRPGLKNIVVWVHGAEIQPWHRRDFNYRNANERRRAKKQSERRMEFWRGLLTNIPSNLHFVFVSNYLRNEVSEDLDLVIPDDKVSIIPNYVDQSKFSYQEKDPEKRKRILSIRPFSSNKYGNDLTVKAIQELSKKTYFNELDFLIVGEGELFEETVKPIRNLRNVKLINRHLSEKEYREIFSDYGVFLCPTRWDSQGVSRDEAMSCGLVAITNRVAAIPEFVSDEEALLVPGESIDGLAKAIDLMFLRPDLFSELSRCGPSVVARKCNHRLTITKEILLIQK